MIYRKAGRRNPERIGSTRDRRVLGVKERSQEIASSDGLGREFLRL